MLRAVLLAAPLLLATTAEDIGASLRRDPVYVDPDAERTISDEQADALRDSIADRGVAIFVAVVGDELGDADDALADVRSATGLSGTYAVVTDDGFRAASTEDPNADELATQVFQEYRGDGPGAVLEAFVDLAGTGTGAQQGAPGPGQTGAPSAEPQEEDSSSPLPLLLLGGGAIAAVAFVRRSGNRRRKEAQAADEADRQLLRAELAVLSDDVLRLEPQVQINEAARTDYEAAVARYRAAEAALDYADSPIDLVRVERVVREAQYAMSRAKAIVEGREPPPPPADLRTPGRHDEPPLDLDERGQPTYVGHPGGFYGGGGWFGGGFGGGGLLSGLLLGQMLGGFGGQHGDTYIDNSTDVFGGGDGGFGGGDWGGDFGGGDVGGGDW